MNVPFDYFADPTSLNFRKNRKYKTHSGFIFTIIFIIAVVGIFIQSLVGMLKRESPTSNTTELYVDDPAPTNIKELPMSFTITPRDNRLVALIPDYHFKLKAYSEEWVYFLDPVTGLPNMVPQATPMVIDRCDISYFQGNEHEQLLASAEQLIDVRALFCIPKTQSEDLFRIQGKIGTLGYRYLKVEFEVCNAPGCASASDLETILATTNVVFAYGDSYIDINNFKKPIQPSKGGDFDHLNINYWREKFIELTPIEVISDDGFLFGTSTTQRGFTVDVTQTVFDPPLTDVRFTFYIRLSNKKIVINRQYKKIQDVLAQTTGIASTLALIFLILLKPYIRIKKSEEMINNVLITDKAKKSNVTFWDYVKSFVGKKDAKLKMEQFYKQRGAIEKRIDILAMLRNMFNIERIMYLSFTPDQKILINNIVAISGDDPNELAIKKDLEANPDVEVIRAIKAISAKPNPDHVDKALLEYHKHYKIGMYKYIEGKFRYDDSAVTSPNMSTTSRFKLSGLEMQPVVDEEKNLKETKNKE